MGIFIITLSFFLIMGCGISLILYISSLLPKIKCRIQKINALEAQIYKELRQIQYNSKDLCKTINKLTNSKNSFLNEIFESLVITVLPFPKIKKLLLLYTFAKKVL